MEFLNYTTKLSYLGEEITIFGKSYTVDGTKMDADRLNSYESGFAIALEGNDFALPFLYNEELFEMNAAYSLIIPYKTYIEEKFPIASLEFAFVKKLNNAQCHELEQIAERYFEDTNRIVYQNNKGASRTIISQTIVLLLALMLCSFNVVCFFKYWLRINKERYRGFFVCGAKRWTICVIKLLELLFIDILGMVLTVCIDAILSVVFNELPVKLDMINIFIMLLASYVITSVVCLKDILFQYMTKGRNAL